MLQVDRRREPPALDRQRADRRLDGPARAQRVAIIALRAADGQPVGVLAEHLLDRGRLGRIVEWGRRRMGIDVADLGRADAAVLQSQPHRARRLAPVGTGAVMWYASFVNAYPTSSA